MKLRISGFSIGKKQNKSELLLMALMILGSFFIPLFFINAKEEGIEITEIMYHPQKGGEWVEIFNNTDDEISLENWGLEEGNNSESVELEGELKPREYLIICDIDNKNNSLEECEKFNGKIIKRKLSLNDNGEGIEILNTEKERIDFVEYKDDWGGDGNGYSIEIEDGEWRESYVIGGTPGEENSQKPKPKKYSDKIRINEILPNPSGDEKRGEYIELYNFSDEDVNLIGWILKDSSKSGKFIFEEEKTIKKNDFLIVYRDEFDFALNNGSDCVYLENPNGEKIYEACYDSAKENLSFGFDDESDEWRWSKFLTPERKNRFGIIPKTEVGIDAGIYKNSYADFWVKFESGKNSNTKIVWDFGDGRKSYQEKTRHKYEKTGKYLVTLKIFTGSEDVLKNFKIEVEEFPEEKIEIIGIMPNPKGRDSGKEWIEIENKEKKEINLKGWGVATGTSSKKMVNHPITKDFVIDKNTIRKITKTFSNFSLGNKKGRIEIRRPDGSVACKLKYEKEKGVGDDDVYSREGEEKWKWTLGVESDEKKKQPENDTEVDFETETEDMIEEESEEEAVESGEEIVLEVQKGESEKENSKAKQIFVTIETENGKNKTFVAGLSNDQRHKDTQKMRKHYLKVFLERINAKMNMFLNK